MLSFKDFTDYCDLSEDGLRSLHNGLPVNGLDTSNSAQPTKHKPQTPQQTLQYLRKYLDYLEKKQRV
ncbi:hypothetical protein [uncultured Thiothrix sp.]|uniref:hypothetical protein n=1 Tax=uncultured Thiothrix sp. TaxID=223185 RepID=UPI002628A94E|nr:hypothetical protein [uncultured Thiothrix sp.]